MVLKKLGRYDIIGVLGKGAMGLVYEARDPNLDRRVAIKTIKVDNLSQKAADEYATRFRTEARSAARLQHPNIVSVYDSDRHKDVAYLVMEFVQGDDLKQHIDDGKVFTLEQSLHMMRDLLAALEYAHVRHIIHRDVKPANLLVEASGRVKLTDFGVARMQDSAEGTRTRGSMVGTLKYMSPEQVQGLLVDARTDIFAAGVVLYQLLTGRRPFDGDSEFAIIQQIISTMPPPPSSINPMLPAALDDVVARALAKSRDLRFDSAQAFALALREAGGFAQDQTIALPIGSASSSSFGGTGSNAQRSRTSGSTVRLSRQPDGSYSTVTQELELVYWKDVKDSDDKQDLLGFLDRFPSGIYADLARRRLRRWHSGAAADLSGASSGGVAWSAPSRSEQGEATLLADERTLLLAREDITAAPKPMPAPAPAPAAVPAAAWVVPPQDLTDVGGPEPLVEDTNAGAAEAVDELAPATDADLADGASGSEDEPNASVDADAVAASDTGAADGAAESAGSEPLADASTKAEGGAVAVVEPVASVPAADAIVVDAADPSVPGDTGDTPDAGTVLAPAPAAVADVAPTPVDVADGELLPSAALAGSDMAQPEPAAAKVPAKASPRKLLLVLASVAMLSIAALWYLQSPGTQAVAPQAVPDASVALPVTPPASDPGADVVVAVPAVVAPVAVVAASAAAAPQVAKVPPVDNPVPAKPVAVTRQVVAKPAVVPSAAVAAPAAAAAPTPVPSSAVPATSGGKPGIAKVGANDIAPSLTPSPQPTAKGLEAACEGRVLLGYQSCMSEQCAKPVFFDHPTCSQRRMAEQARKAQQSNRN